MRNISKRKQTSGKKHAEHCLTHVNKTVCEIWSVSDKVHFWVKILTPFFHQTLQLFAWQYCKWKMIPDFTITYRNALVNWNPHPPGPGTDRGIISTWCIHKSRAFEMEPLNWAARIITSNHIIITRLWTTTKTPELIPSSGYFIIGLLFSCSSSFMCTSLSSLLYRIKMCYPHFNIFSSQKGLLCKFFYIFWVQVSAPLLSFLKAFLDNSTRRVSMSCGWIAAVCG